MDVVVWELTPAEVIAHRADLVELLVSCVEGGSSVGFLRGITNERAEEFWASMQSDFESGSAVFIGARVDGHVRGSTIIKRALSDNGRHRARYGV
ncbi:MAG: hypothetical protein ACYDCC_01160 [Actinomycetota bacterium]